MGKTELLRVQDVRDAYRLIGDCRDLGSDLALWYPRMLQGLGRLIGAIYATGGEVLWLRPHYPLTPIAVFDAGLDSRGRERFVAYIRDHGPAADPLCQALQRVPGRLVTRTRQQLVSDAVWYRSIGFTDYRRLAHVDHQLTAVFQVSDHGAASLVALNRSLGERDFSPREHSLLNFFHGELGRLIGRSLVSVTDPNPGKLSPRLRQTLSCLLEGDSEKQVAARLGISYATTHQYVTTLYRHFRVQSRAQLLAYAFKRVGRGHWRRFPAETQ